MNGYNILKLKISALEDLLYEETRKEKKDYKYIEYLLEEINYYENCLTKKVIL